MKNMKQVICIVMSMLFFCVGCGTEKVSNDNNTVVENEFNNSEKFSDGMDAMAENES